MALSKYILKALFFGLFYAAIAVGLTWFFHDAFKGTAIAEYSAMEKLEDGMYDIAVKHFHTSYSKKSVENKYPQIVKELEDIAVVDIDSLAFDFEFSQFDRSKLIAFLSKIDTTKVQCVFIDANFSEENNPELISAFRQIEHQLVLPFNFHNRKNIAYKVDNMGFNNLLMYYPESDLLADEMVRFIQFSTDTSEFITHTITDLTHPHRQQNIDKKGYQKINYLIAPFPDLGSIVSGNNNNQIVQSFRLSDAIEDDSLMQVINGKKAVFLGIVSNYKNKHGNDLYLDKHNTPVVRDMPGLYILLNVYLSNLLGKNLTYKPNKGLYAVFVVNFCLALFFFFIGNRIIGTGILSLLLTVILSIVVFLFLSRYFLHEWNWQVPLVISLLIFQKSESIYNIFNIINVKLIFYFNEFRNKNVIPKPLNS